MEINFNIKMTEGQQIAWKTAHERDCKRLVMCYSRQSGKTILAEMLLIEHLMMQGKFSAYISPTFNLGRKVFKEIVRLLEGSGIISKANASTLTIETKIGSQLQFFSAEAYTAIRGFTVSGILVIDEAAYIQDILPNGEEFWGNVVMPLTKARKPLVVMISTPCGKHGFFYDFYMRAMMGEKGLKAIKRTIYDDTLVTPEDIEDIKRSIPPKAFQQEFECEFLDSSLTFFEGFEACFDEMKYDTSGSEWIGIDLSANGADDTVVARVNSKGEFKVEKVSGTLDMKYQGIADIINRSKACVVYMEANGIGAPMINEVRKLVKGKDIVEWMTTNASKEEIISDLAVRIANKEVKFDKEDVDLWAQLSTFVSKVTKGRRLTFAAMDGKHDDMVMAVAIALRARRDYGFRANRTYAAIIRL